jgi:hypothetical protein
MSKSPFAATLAILLTVTIIAPSTFLIAPQKVHAQGFPVYDNAAFWPTLKTSVESTITAIKSTITAIAAPVAAAAEVAQQVNDYVLQPLAFVLSGNLLKLMTAGVISFVIGKANGTGIPQFVVDIRQSFQTVSDVHTLAYFDQYMRSSQSPYTGSIISALRKEYLNKTSLAGFWAANMDTLARSSPNVNAYLAGNWSQGGVGAWFALTTQIQNNPYTKYQNARDQLGNLIGPGAGGATGVRAAELAQGNGFTNWCGSSDGFLGSITTTATPLAAVAAAATAANADYTAAYNAAAADPTDAALQADVVTARNAADAAAAAYAAAQASSDVAAASSPIGVNPGDPCTNADGTPGTIKTPGSVIVASLNKVLGGQQDSVVRMGNVGPEINKILGNIATIIKTVDFAVKILGGPGSGGLFGVDQSSGSNSTSRLMQYQNSPGNLGVTQASVYQTAATLPSSGFDKLSLVAQYESAWNSIRGAANTASTSVTSLASFCIAQQTIASNTLATSTLTTDITNLTNFMNTSNAQASAAQTALTTKIAPVLAQADTASTTIAAARAMVQKVQTELNSGAAGAGGAYAADIQTLQAMPPTLQDVANAQQGAQAFGTSVANPAGSLNVSEGSSVDQMNLISTNATALRSVCTAPAPLGG